MSLQQLRFDRAQIEQYIPQREPFIFVDEIVDFVEGQSARSIKHLTGQEPFFAGHFPGQPVLPGVLILENMAQTANFLVAKSAGTSVADGSARMVFGMVNRARFLRPVIPEATLETQITVVKLLSQSGIVDAVSCVDGQEVATAKLQFGAMA